MNRKKIGIITHYYKSNNYGGCLQAYALTRFLNSLDCDAEQISFKRYLPGPPCVKDRLLRQKENKTYIEYAIWLINKSTTKFFDVCFGFLFKRKVLKLIGQREKSFDAFREKKIASSSLIYDANSISDCCQYDYYVSGSDIVWAKEFGEFCNAYWLDFTDSANKIAYAASPPLVNLSDDDKCFVKKKLSDYRAISVREKVNCQYIKNIIGEDNAKNKKLTNVIDPVFLLPCKQWLCLTESYKNSHTHYAFLYGFNMKKKFLRYCKRYCKANKLELVYIPYINVQFSTNDFFMRCTKEYCGPEGFISLIKNANIIFTNSFHAVAFSLIFNKKFISTKRDGNHPYGEGKNSRIYGLLNKFDLNYCHIINNLVSYTEFEKKVASLSIDFNLVNKRIEEERIKSIDFLNYVLDMR